MGQGVSRKEIEANYELFEEVGSGNYATVRRARRRKDKKEFAVKIIRKRKLNPKELAFVKSEVVIHKKITHPNVCSVIEVFENQEKIFLVLELLRGGTIFDKAARERGLSELQAAAITRDIASALFYCHKIGIVHRDLKPENVLFENKRADSRVKITDFGLAKYIKQTELMSTCCGSPNYVAPEVLFRNKYNEAVDLWSLGVTLYMLLCGFRPFENSNPTQLYRMIMKGRYSFPKRYWQDVSPAAKDLVKRLLTMDPKRRITAEGVLTHPWVCGGVARRSSLGPDHSMRLRVLKEREKLRTGVHFLMAINRWIHYDDPQFFKPRAAAAAADSTESRHRRNRSIGAHHSFGEEPPQYARLEDDDEDDEEKKTPPTRVKKKTRARTRGRAQTVAHDDSMVVNRSKAVLPIGETGGYGEFGDEDEDEDLQPGEVVMSLDEEDDAAGDTPPKKQKLPRAGSVQEKLAKLREIQSQSALMRQRAQTAVEVIAGSRSRLRRSESSSSAAGGGDGSSRRGSLRQLRQQKMNEVKEVARIRAYDDSDVDRDGSATKDLNEARRAVNETLRELRRMRLLRMVRSGEHRRSSLGSLLRRKLTAIKKTP